MNRLTPKQFMRILTLINNFGQNIKYYPSFNSGLQDNLNIKNIKHDIEEELINIICTDTEFTLLKECIYNASSHIKVSNNDFNDKKYSVIVTDILYTFISNMFLYVWNSWLDLCLTKPNASNTFTTIIHHIRDDKWEDNKNFILELLIRKKANHIPGEGDYFSSD